MFKVLTGKGHQTKVPGDGSLRMIRKPFFMISTQPTYTLIANIAVPNILS